MVNRYRLRPPNRYPVVVIIVTCGKQVYDYDHLDRVMIVGYVYNISQTNSRYEQVGASRQ